MTALSKFAIRHRWWGIVGWIAGMVLVQALSSWLGGAKYKDDFRLPGTESQAVATLLSNSHLAWPSRTTRAARSCCVPRREP